MLSDARRAIQNPSARPPAPAPQIARFRPLGFSAWNGTVLSVRSASSLFDQMGGRNRYPHPNGRMIRPRRCSGTEGLMPLVRESRSSIRRISGVCLLFTLSLSAQTKTTGTQSFGPLPVATVIEAEASSRTDWDLTIAYRHKDYPPKGAQQAVEDLDKFVLSKPEPGGNSPRLLAEHLLMGKYHTDLDRLVSVSLGPLLYTVTPARLASKDGELTLLLTSIGSENVYNTLRLDARERAAKEIQATVLPELKQFRVVTAPAIRNFGVIVIYGTKDFSEEDSTPKPELVALVASAGNCRKLIAATMTEEDFAASADTYIVDKDQVLADVRKIRISLGND